MNFSVNTTQLNRDIALQKFSKYEAFWSQRSFSLLSRHFEAGHKEIFLEVGAGTGWFFVSMAKLLPHVHFVAVERDRMRGNRLMHRAKREGLKNLGAYRGNIIPSIMHGIASESLDRIYILYPCPWPKTSQRKHRWYLSPVMTHLVRVLKPGGLLIWASDQRFYIDEAGFICEKQFHMMRLAQGEITHNPWNSLDLFPKGRTKFEATFLANDQPCYELIVRKS